MTGASATTDNTAEHTTESIARHMVNDKHPAKKVIVLISGNGSNLQTLIDHLHLTEEPVNIVAVFSNIENAFGLQRAQNAGIDNYFLDHKAFLSRDEFDSELSHRIDRYAPDLILLAGFMRILTAGFVNHYYGKMLNIHPSLLPKYQGLHTHQRALAAKDKIHGASVHFVTEELDGGPVVIQAVVPVLATDTIASLAARVLVQEHLIYPEAVRWFCHGRLALTGGLPLLDQQALGSTGMRIKNVDD